VKNQKRTEKKGIFFVVDDVKRMLTYLHQKDASERRLGTKLNKEARKNNIYKRQGQTEFRVIFPSAEATRTLLWRKEMSVGRYDSKE
jgi:hypothetical protein